VRGKRERESAREEGERKCDGRGREKVRGKRERESAREEGEKN